MFGKLGKNWKTKKNNRGAAMIMVIVSIAFIGMLVAMIVYMAYCNYMMKSSDKVAKNNFYSAESVLDAINAGIQQDISDSISEAYVVSMQDSLGKTEDDMSEAFQKKFFAKLEEKLATAATKTSTPTSDPSSSPTEWNLTRLIEYATYETKADGTNQDRGGFTRAASKGDKGAWVEACGSNKITQFKREYMTLNNIRVVYTDDKGYVSIIETDIRIKIPDLNYAVASGRLEVENYSVIANETLIADGKFSDGENAPDFRSSAHDTKVTGNVYGGQDGIYVANDSKLSFEDDTSDSVSNYYLIAGSLNVGNAKVSDSASDIHTIGKGLVVDQSHDNYTGGVNVTTGSLVLNGNTFVRDDITIAGTGSTVSLGGIYRGYGDSLNGADGSSSILVNGGKTKLDFSYLTELLLSGHAYVGARHYDADADRYKSGMDLESDVSPNSDYVKDTEEYQSKIQGYTDTANSIKRNTSDIMMGESVSVKANQMVYMVPSDCMANGKNPMSYAEYEKLMSARKVDASGNLTDELETPIVDLSNLWEKLGSSFTSGYKAVFRRVSGSVLVYFYLDFGSNELQANQFFQAYYKYDKAGLTNYVNSYIDSINWGSALTDDTLTLAGNAFKFVNGELVLQEDNLNSSEQKMSDALTNAEVYENTYLALSCMLKPDINETTSTQQGQSVYDNIVNKVFLSKVGTKTFKDDADSVRAVVTDDNYTYSGDDDKIKLIIAANNVYLEKDFSGLVIAGGSVYVGSDCKNILYDPVNVIKALRTKYTDGAKTMYAYEALGDSGKLSYAETAAVADNEYVDLGSLITYENWKKE